MSVFDADRIEYFKLKDEEAWKLQLATEIIGAKANIKEIPGFNNEDFETILDCLFKLYKTLVFILGV